MTDQGHLAEILHGDVIASLQKSTLKEESGVMYPQHDTRGIFLKFIFCKLILYSLILFL